MPTSIRPSGRKNKETPSMVMTIATGKTKTIRRTITPAVTTLALPEGITAAIIQNSGLFPIRIRINASGGDFFTLSPGQVLSKIVISRAIIDAMAVGGDSALEVIVEG